MDNIWPNLLITTIGVSLALLGQDLWHRAWRWWGHQERQEKLRRLVEAVLNSVVHNVREAERTLQYIQRDVLVHGDFRTEVWDTARAQFIDLAGDANRELPYVTFFEATKKLRNRLNILMLGHAAPAPASDADFQSRYASIAAAYESCRKLAEEIKRTGDDLIEKNGTASQKSRRSWPISHSSSATVLRALPPPAASGRKTITKKEAAGVKARAGSRKR